MLFCYMKKLNSPSFKLDYKNLATDLQKILNENREKIVSLNDIDKPTWQNFIMPMEDLSDTVNQFWAPISHLNAVTNNPELRAAYNDCLPLLSDYSTELGQNKNLFLAYKKINDSQQFNDLDYAQQATINYALRDFHLSGVTLNDKQQQRYKQLNTELSTLSTKFSENILDASKQWQKHIENKNQLSGLPKQRLQLAAETAATKGLSGWLLTLDYPCYHDVMTFADAENLREEFYHAFNTRASDQGKHNADYDNSIIMQKILAHRNEIAHLLGFKHYAELSLEPKMANSPQQVLEFLTKLVDKVKPQAKLALENLQHFIGRSSQQLYPWNIAYYSEKLREKNYAINTEELRAYFPAEHVIQGLFTIVDKLYGIKLKKVEREKWHADVSFYELYSENNELIGGLYFDLYTRPDKRSGAWMDELVCRRKLANSDMQLPIALLNCNFAAATNTEPALLTHEDVITLFHEFGHCLQHLLTKIDYLDVSGINNVPWDAVEFPSQFFEAWCWEKESLALISCHYQTKKPLPDNLIAKLIAAKNFQSALFLIRQLEFAVFDMRLHIDYEIEPSYVQHMLEKVRQQIAVIPIPNYNRFAHSFSHIFAGGYAAGYYSYLWAEVLARDAFSTFKSHGIFNRQLGERFKQIILAEGGAQNPEELFTNFMHRSPNNDALLQYYGLH